MASEGRDIGILTAGAGREQTLRRAPLQPHGGEERRSSSLAGVCTPAGSCPVILPLCSHSWGFLAARLPRGVNPLTPPLRLLMQHKCSCTQFSRAAPLAAFFDFH